MAEIDFNSLVNEITQAGNGSFEAGLDTLDLTKRGKRRVLRGERKFQKAKAKGRNFELGDNNFQVRDENNSLLQGSGARKGASEQFNAGSLLGLGRDVSFLAGALQQQKNKSDDVNTLVERTSIDTIPTIGTTQANVDANLMAGLNRIGAADIINTPSGSTKSTGSTNIQTEPPEDDFIQPDLNRLAFPFRDNTAPDGTKILNRFTRPTIIEENRGPLAKANPELFQQYLDDDENGALNELLLDQEMGRSGSITPDEFDERFRQYVKFFKFDEGAGNQALLSKGDTFDALNALDPARQVQLLDFQDKNNNLSDIIDAAAIISSVKAGTTAVKTIKQASDAAKIAAKVFKKPIIKTGRTVGENIGFKGAKAANAIKNKARDLIKAGKNKILSPAKKVGKNVAEGTKPLPKPTPKVAATVTKQPITKIMQNPTVRKSFTPEKLTAEINAFIAKNPAAKQMSLSNGQRVKLVGGAWKLFRYGGKLSASTLIK